MINELALQVTTLHAALHDGSFSKVRSPKAAVWSDATPDPSVWRQDARYRCDSRPAALFVLTHIYSNVG